MMVYAVSPKLAAARFIASARRLLAFIFFCTEASTSGGAVSGEPALNGGAGLYSIPSWIVSAVFRSARIDTSVSAKSIPAVTPPPVTRLRSTHTRVHVGTAPNAGRYCIADQCVAAL